MQAMKGGHCFTCHEDYVTEFWQHKCYNDPHPTVCDSACADSPFRKKWKANQSP